MGQAAALKYLVGTRREILRARPGWGGREGVAFAWDLARPPGTPASRSRGFLHGRTCSLAVVLSVGSLLVDH